MTSELWAVAESLLGTLKRSGPENVMCRCPFHTKRNGQQERTPSFALSVTTGLWFCHSCKERGGFASLLRACGVSPRKIDEVYGPLLEELSSNYDDRRRSPRCVVLSSSPPLEESILGFFQAIPLGLEEQGFTEGTILHFEAGYDERNMRITYPLRDMLGRLVGISGRAVGDGLPRYKVYGSEDYALWGIPPHQTEKGHILWNFDRVYPALYFQGGEEVILVEGFKACMWVYQAGYTNTVALLGSHMSGQQRLLLERLGCPVYLFLDNDDAGHRARDKTAKELNESLRVKVVEYDAKQPTDLSPVQVRAAIMAAQDFLGWAINR